jgi:hypothetical protein
MTVAAVPLWKRLRVRARLDNGSSVVLSVPSIWCAISGARATLRYERAGEPARQATMLHAFFKQPVMAIAGPTDATVLCVYDFDVGYRVIVFNVNATQSEANEELKIIVPKSDMAARHANAEEIAFAAERIRAMPATSFEASSVPTIDLGFVKVYAQQGNVVARIGETLSRERNRIAAAQPCP